MPITISGSTGIAGVDGSAGTPAVQGTTTNTGVYYPAVNQVAITTNGTQQMLVDASGNVGIGTSSPGERLQVSGGNFGILGATGTSFTGFVNQNNGASASAYRGLFYDGRNENGVAVANMLIDVNTDGSSGWVWSTTPSGSRTSDRRVDRMRITSTGDLQFNSGYGSVATAYGCRAWVNFNGTTASPSTIRGSGNVSSVTKNGTGDYTVNFTNAMPDANYAVVGLGYAGATDNTTLRGIEQRGAPTTGGTRIVTMNAINTSTYDGDYVNVAVFR